MSNQYNNGQRINSTAVLVSVVAMVALASAVLLGVALTGKVDAKNTPLIVTVLGLIASTIPSVLALLRVDATRRDLHNGLIPEKVIEGVQQGVEQGTLHVRLDRTGLRTRSSDEGNNNG